MPLHTRMRGRLHRLTRTRLHLRADAHMRTHLYHLFKGF
jgi:hypothetical protein